MNYSGLTENITWGTDAPRDRRLNKEILKKIFKYRIKKTKEACRCEERKEDNGKRFRHKDFQR